MTQRFLARILLAATLAAIGLGGVAATPAGRAEGLSIWTGKVDLYRTGAFTTQKTWLWCTAADLQIIRNIADRETDHSRASQQRYFDYMRAHNRYDIPEKDGVDPAGWTAGLRHYVDRRYRLVASRSFDAALRSAVTSLRKTNLPVGITVAHGSHAWVLTGFSATADPAATTKFTVTSVRVVGPLWGLQSRDYGYDMRPATKLTVKQLRGFFTPWHYVGVRMAWEDRWVSVQAKPDPDVAVSPPASEKPTTSPMPSGEAASESASMLPRPIAAAVDPSGAPPGPSAAAGQADTAPASDQQPLLPITVLIAGVLAALLAGLGLRRRAERRPAARSGA